MENFRATLVLVIAVGAWIGTFLLGIALDAGVYFERLTADETGALAGVWAFLCLAASWTWSNVLAMCCLAALVGEYGRDAMTPRRQQPNSRAAIVRGFFIFLAISAGQLVIAGNISLPQAVADAADPGNPLVNSPGQYFRLAAFCSLLGFLVGFTPRLFTTFLKGLERIAGGDA